MTPKHTPPTKTNPSFSRNSLSSGQFCTNTVLQTGESLQKSASPSIGTRVANLRQALEDGLILTLSFAPLPSGRGSIVRTSDCIPSTVVFLGGPLWWRRWSKRWRRRQQRKGGGGSKNVLGGGGASFAWLKSGSSSSSSSSSILTKSVSVQQSKVAPLFARSGRGRRTHSTQRRNRETGPGLPEFYYVTQATEPDRLEGGWGF